MLTASGGPSVAPSLTDPRVAPLAVQLAIDHRVGHVEVAQAQVHVVIDQATCRMWMGGRSRVSCVCSEYVDTALVHPDKYDTQLFVNQQDKIDVMQKLILNPAIVFTYK